MESLIVELFLIGIIAVVLFLRERDRELARVERNEILDRLMARDFGEYLAIKTAHEQPGEPEKVIPKTTDTDQAWAS